MMFIKGFDPAEPSREDVRHQRLRVQDSLIAERQWRLPIYFARVQFYFSAELLNNLQGG